MLVKFVGISFICEDKKESIVKYQTYFRAHADVTTAHLQKIAINNYSVLEVELSWTRKTLRKATFPERNTEK